MDRREYFNDTLGRAVYDAILAAIANGATEDDVRAACGKAWAKAERAMKEAGVTNDQQ